MPALEPAKPEGAAQLWRRQARDGKRNAPGKLITV